MSNARNLARVVAATSGAIAATNLANAVPADGSITTAKLAANAVTDAKLASGIKKVFAVKSSVTGQTEARSGFQNGTFLNSTSSYISGLTAITHAASSTNNYLVFRFHANFRGQATSDAVQTNLFKDGSVLQGGAIMHGNQSTGNTAREMSISTHAIVKPTDTNSHSYMIGWACTEGGVTNMYINQTEDPNYSTQCTFEMWEVEIDQANASGNSLNAYYFS